MEAHHLEDFSNNLELATDVNNGVTVCVKCHKKFHSRFGCKRNIVNHFIKFLEEMWDARY
jgi:5-methylcytosine-specific restriction endonuclease McrA